jgi:uncharacterized membrane protein HdeD (DUF308 family)
MKNLLKYFGLFMVIVYLGIGIFLILMGENSAFLNRTTRLVLGIALIVYGIFRAWRVFKTQRDEKPD